MNARPASEPEPLTFEEAQAQTRRRWLLWGTPALVILLLGVWFTARPALHGVKAWQARRLADRSLALADAGQLMEAADNARDALMIYRDEPEVWRAFGRLLSRIGKRGDALLWWRKVEHAGRLTAEDRRDWVAAALAADAPGQAETQLKWLLAQDGGGTPADLLLAARAATWHQDSASVESFDRRVLAAPAASPRERFSAAAQILYLPAPAPETTALASAALSQLARARTDPLALDALTLLANRALAGSEAADLTASEIAAALDAHPKAGAIHHLLALELRVRTDPAKADECVAQALQTFRGSADDQTTAELATWLTRLGRNDAVLQLLDPTSAARSPELARAYLDALAAAGRWSDARTLLDDEHLPLDPVSLKTYLAIVRGQLGEADGSAREWDRALEAAGKDPEKLLALGLFASHHGAGLVADKAFGAAIDAAPAWRAPYVARYQLALAGGQTAAAKDLVTEILRRWPGDRSTGDELVYLRLLHDPSVMTADATEKETTARLAEDPANWQVKTNVALADLRQGRGAAAVAVLTGRSEELPSRPADLDSTAPVRAQVVFAAALAASGERERSGGEARRLNSLSMLPEERELIAALIAAAPGG